MRTDKDMALDFLADPPRAVLDGFGRKRGELWEKFQREVLAAAEKTFVEGGSLRTRLSYINLRYKGATFDFGPETDEERRRRDGWHAEDVARAEKDGEMPFAVLHRELVPCGCLAEVVGWAPINLNPTAFIVPPWVGPYFLIHEIRMGRVSAWCGAPVPANEFVERRRLALPRICMGDLLVVVAENIDGAMHSFSGTFWCVPPQEESEL